MRTFLVQWMREVRSIFYTPVAYVVMVLFLMMMGFNFQVMVTALNRTPTEVTALEITFTYGIFIYVYAMTTALITMRSFSDEYRMGTIEMLTTAPVKDWHVVLAKYFGALTFYMILFGATLSMFIAYNIITHGAVVARSLGAFGSTYLLLTLMGSLYVSIGVFASSLVRDQINAALISITANLLLLFVPVFVSGILNVTDPRVRQAAEFVSPYIHMGDFSKGLVDSRRVVWYLSASAFLVFLTHHVFHSRKLKS